MWWVLGTVPPSMLVRAKPLHENGPVASHASGSASEKISELRFVLPSLPREATGPEAVSRGFWKEDSETCSVSLPSPLDCFSARMTNCSNF